jgi:hypothetical protein
MLVKGRVKRDGVAQPLTNKTAKHDKGQEQPVFLVCSARYTARMTAVKLASAWQGVGCNPAKRKSGKIDRPKIMKK